ncbi:hypothetical protein BGY98DRAFT_931986 [Russula aff. rugulosa BPL654]|nr:hypothetical protein BGY98DRAFT_931986 [Russula aff. rugulosa BPL654]
MTPATGTIALNNYLQVKGRLASLSWYDTSSGPAHEPEWKSDCKIDGEVIASGKGTHKHLARDAAAEIALEKLMKEEEGRVQTRIGVMMTMEVQTFRYNMKHSPPTHNSMSGAAYIWQPSVHDGA